MKVGMVGLGHIGNNMLAKVCEGFGGYVVKTGE